MDISIEAVVVLMVSAIVAFIVIGMATSESDSFKGFLGSQTDAASCELGYSQYKSRVDCDAQAGDGTDFEQKDKWEKCNAADSQDGWYARYCGDSNTEQSSTNTEECNLPRQMINGECQSPS
ncbi:hypothetical protein [Candidatus Nanohalobium constans]|uniref:Uncharacterized protein n=1 Tax=Candidatus Nanohalobium constans TaxID=2565781 RepID=A0A5Q0UIQ8_9ARCH|nr:hypothetical protein [Candidatus Nanohalobium constans]QGA80835.1 hypothetical protein LC1Nh_0953 [Candidatus Nanohalobium constans]